MIVLSQQATGATTIFEEVANTELVAHEIAHMWFGDLVALDWWNEIWIKEGLSTYWQVIGACPVLLLLHLTGTVCHFLGCD